MGFSSGSRKNKSFQRAKENFSFYLKLTLILSSTLLASNCTSIAPTPKTQSTSPAAADKTSPSPDLTNLGIQLTKDGDNDWPAWSNDGTRLTFSSKNRSTHNQEQIYVFDLVELKERRLTYQDGSCVQPIFSRDGKSVIYSSDSDEAKERPQLFYQAAKSQTWPPSEIYEQSLTGLDIKRWTHHEGYDGQAWLQPHFVSFEQWNGENLEVWQITEDSERPHLLLRRPEQSVESFRLRNVQKKSEPSSAWIERDRENVTTVYLSGFPIDKNPKPLELPKAEYRDLSWWHDQLILSSNILNQKFQAFSYDTKTKCLRQLFEHKDDIWHPQMHPDRDAVAFVATVSGHRQVFYKSLNIPTEPTDCIR